MYMLWLCFINRSIWTTQNYLNQNITNLYYKGPKPKYNTQKWFHRAHGPLFQQTVDFLLEQDLDLLSCESYPTKARHFINKRVCVAKLTTTQFCCCYTFC